MQLVWILGLLRSIAVAAPVAAPEFVGAPEDVAAAAVAWEAAVECTGWTPRFHPQVEIVHGEDPAGFAGRAYIDGDGLFRIAVFSEKAPPSTIAHEVAHTWIHRGRSALVEGLTDLLAECIASKAPELSVRLDSVAYDVNVVPPLHTWENPDQEDKEARHAAYAASYALARAAARVIDPQRLWADGQARDWPWFWALMQTRQPITHEHWQVFKVFGDHGHDVDMDLDGLTVREEAALGTDPWEWDSDGDGFWDGATPPEGALPIVATEAWVCAGVAAGRSPVDVQFAFGGPLAGELYFYAQAAGTEWMLDETGQLRLPAASDLLIRAELETDAPATGGAWLVVSGKGLRKQDCPGSDGT